MGGVSDALGLGGGGDDASDAAIEGSQIQADYQREALAYLKEREAIPQQYREQAIQQLGGAYGIGDEGSQQQFIDQAKASPLYQSLLEGGEESVLRNRAATGSLRSGAAISDLKDVQNNALLTSYNQQLQGLGGLAGLPSLAPAIAGATSGIGTTLGQGIIGAAQSQQAAQQQGIGNAFGLGQLGLQAYNTFSDIRLKSNIKYIGRRNGIKRYKWTWNEEAEKLGLSGEDKGYMAHEVYEVRPDVIGECNGYITINVQALEAA